MEEELSDRLRCGLQLAELRFLETSANRGKRISQGTPDGKVIYVPATELLARFQEQERSQKQTGSKSMVSQ